jgi:hypothetical protein
MEGLWYAHFTAGPVQGDGMAVLHNGEILGGDPAHVYSGSYQSDGPNLYANVRVSPYGAAKVPADLHRPLEVFLKGSVTGDLATMSGHPEQKSELKIAVELHRAS